MRSLRTRRPRRVAFRPLLTLGCATRRARGRLCASRRAGPIPSATRPVIMQTALAGPARTDSQEAHVEVQVSVVMPCLNEARTVGRCVDKARKELERLGVPAEVIV